VSKRWLVSQKDSLARVVLLKKLFGQKVIFLKFRISSKSHFIKSKFFVESFLSASQLVFCHWLGLFNTFGGSRLFQIIFCFLIFATKVF